MSDKFPAIIRDLLKLTPEQEIARARWQYRAVERTRGNQTPLGTILLAVLQQSAMHGPPRLGHHAVIAENGIVCTTFQDRNRNVTPVYAVDHIDNIRDAFRKLADGLKLTQSEAEEMMGELRKWITHDLRAAPPPLTEQG